MILSDRTIREQLDLGRIS
ncbi:MAG: hypothetical protein ACKVKO_03815, partial [Acidimicrobiales bacterium]